MVLGDPWEDLEVLKEMTIAVPFSVKAEADWAHQMAELTTMTTVLVYEEETKAAAKIDLAMIGAIAVSVIVKKMDSNLEGDGRTHQATENAVFGAMTQDSPSVEVSETCILQF